MKLKMKYNKLFFFLLIGIFMISFISSAPPPQVNINTLVGIEIEYLNIETFEENQDIHFAAHIFNISNGLVLTNITTDCFLHLLNNRGDHIIGKVNMGYSSINEAFHYTVLKNNFTRLGEYNPLIICNSTNIGGFVSFNFEVTESGSVLKDGEGNVLFGIILILIFTTFFFLIATIYVPNLPFKIFLGSLAILMLVSTIGFGVTIMQQLFGIFTNLTSGYNLFYRLFIILLGGAGIGLILFLVVFALRIFNQSKGTVE